jgi:hypothetical protein
MRFLPSDLDSNDKQDVGDIEDRPGSDSRDNALLPLVI